MFETLAASPVTRAIGVALLHFIWQGAVVAAATAWLLHRLRRVSATTRYLVSCAALLTMAIAPLVTMARALDEPVASSTVTLTDATTIRGTTAAPGDSPALPSNERGAGATGLVAATANDPAMFLPVIVLAWALGVGVLTINLTGAWIGSVRLKRTASPVGDPWRGQLARAAERLGVVRRIVLSQSSSIDVPTLVGWIRPAIVVPVSVLAGLTPAQLDAILTHELAHVRRHDYLVNLFQSAVETVLFYHPAVWWLSRRIRLERELCCDDIVVAVCADRVVYARALASLEELRNRRPVLGVAATGGNLLERVRRILAPAEIDESRSSAWGVLATGAVIAPLFFVGGVVERTTSAEPKPSADIALAASERPREIVQTWPAAVAAQAQPLPQTRKPDSATTDQAAVLALEEQFCLAKVEANIETLERILDDAFVETNQNGNMRNKAETIDLWRSFRIKLLTLDSTDVQMIGDLARVTGRQTEINGGGTDRMLFTRVWRRVNGTWKLFSVTQFRDPNASRTPPAVAATPPQLLRLEYELYKGDALLGRPTVNTVSGRPWTIEIPGEVPVSVTATNAGPGATNLTFSGGSATASVKGMTLSGNAPQELLWTSGTSTYRLRIRNLANASPISGGSAPVSVGGDIRRPTLVRQIPPVYPQAAKDARVSGMVIVEIVVDEGGNVTDATIVRSVPMLDAAALDAVRQWQYTPTLLNGNPVKIAMSVNVTFSLQ